MDLVHEALRVWIPSRAEVIEIDIANLTAEAMGIETIAWALSTANRYGGHTPEPYSVALHSIIASYMTPDEFALEALMHDAAEAYIGDLIRPIKRIPAIYQVWKRLESHVDGQLRQHYALPEHESPEVKDADTHLAYVEQLMLRGVNPHGELPVRDVVRFKLLFDRFRGHDYYAFLRRFQFLQGRRDGATLDA